MDAQDLPEGTVTVLFTDIVGSTALTTRLGDTAARDLMRACEELVRAQVTAQRGIEIKGLGDGHMVAFPSARRAVSCAIDIQRAIDRRNQQLPDDQAELRIGLNTGEVVREDGDLFGATVNAAARIAAAASPGEIFVSDAVKSVLGGSLPATFEDRGEYELRGFPQPWRLHDVQWAADANPVRTDGDTPFIGRQPERDQLTRLIEATQAGQGGLVLLGGEAGVGKSRLSTEALAEARRAGLLTLVGHCEQGEGQSPFAPFVEMIDRIVRLVPPDALRGALGSDAAEVARVAPQLRHLFPDIPEPTVYPPEQARRMLLDSLRRFIEGAAQVQPLFLLWEDLHWADASTLALIQHLARTVSDMPLLMIGTYRNNEVEPGSDFAATLSLLSRDRLATRISISRMGLDDIAAMLRGLTAQEPPKEVVAAFAAETDGLPFFVEEVFLHLHQQGLLLNDDGQWAGTLEIEETQVPESVALVVQGRVRQRSPGCQELLTLAAASGREVTFDFLRTLSEADESQLLEALDEAEREHILVSVDQTELRYRLSHELVRQTLLSDLSTVALQQLHGRIAAALETYYGPQVLDHAAELSAHLARAGAFGSSEATIRFTIRAAEQALESFAWHAALQHAQVAPPAASAVSSARLAELRGRALYGLQQWDEASAEWDQALSAYEAAGEGATAATLCMDLAALHSWSGDFPRALAVCARGLRGTEPGQLSERAQLLAFAAMGEAFTPGGDRAETAARLSEAERLAKNSEDDFALARVLWCRAIHGNAFDLVDRRIESGLRAAEILLGEGGDPSSGSHALTCACLGLFLGGRLETLAGHVERAADVAQQSGNSGARLIAYNSQVPLVWMLKGDLREAALFAQEAVAYESEVGVPWGYETVLLAAVQFWAGEWEAAASTLESDFPMEIPGPIDGLVTAMQFVIRAYRGDEGAADLLRRKEALLADSESATNGIHRMTQAAVEGFAMLGADADAASLYPQVARPLEEGQVVMFHGVGLVEKVAGIAAACGTEFEKSETHFETALRQAEDLPHVIEQPEVRRWYAWMLLRRDQPGDRDQARQFLTAAIEQYRSIGMPKHLEMAEQMLAEA